MVKQAIAFEPEALKVLQDFNWTDNLYQMKTVIQELIMYAKSSLITAEEAAYVLKKYETDDNPSHTSGGSHWREHWMISQNVLSTRCSVKKT